MKTLQAVDQALGLAACVLLQPLRLTRWLRRTEPEVERVLLVKFWGLGSLQLLTPAVRALRKRHPNADLTLLTLRQNREFAEGLGAFSEVLSFDVGTRSWPTLFGRILALVAELRRRRFQVVYDFEFFTRFSAVIALLTGARRMHGFAASSVWRGRFHTDTVPFNRYWHVSRNFRCLAGGESGRDVSYVDLIPFAVGPEEEHELDRALAEAGLAEDGPLTVLNPNAGSLSLERRWPQGHFAALARALVEHDGARVVLIGAPSERAWTGEVAAKTSDLPAGRVADLSGRLSIGALHALLGRAALFVGNDSGPMHLAAAQGAPTIGLFGPETPVMYAPIGPRASALYRPPACSPCINVHDNKVTNCVRGRPECLTNLGVGEVLTEARAQMRRGEHRRFELLPAAFEGRPVATPR